MTASFGIFRCHCKTAFHCALQYSFVQLYQFTRHTVPCGKFHRIGGAPPETFPSEKYDAPEKVGGDRKSFDSPIRK